jgi:hypothetical protein
VDAENRDGWLVGEGTRGKSVFDGSLDGDVGSAGLGCEGNLDGP